MSIRQPASIDRREAIMNAALEAFSRYGFRRTSIEDVADLAGVSRPLVYTHFKNKADLFASGAKWLSERIMADTEAAWPEDAAFEDGFAAAALAKGLPLFRLLKSSPHGAELMERSAQSNDGMREAMAARFSALIASRIGRRKGAQAFARMAARALDGVKASAQDEAQFEEDVRALARALAAGIREAFG